MESISGIRFESLTRAWKALRVPIVLEGAVVPRHTRSCPGPSLTTTWGPHR